MSALSYALSAGLAIFIHTMLAGLNQGAIDDEGTRS